MKSHSAALSPAFLRLFSLESAPLASRGYFGLQLAEHRPPGESLGRLKTSHQ